MTPKPNDREHPANDADARRERARRAGRASGEARRRKAKEREPGLLAAYRRWRDRDPDEAVQRLSTTVYGLKLLERELEREEKAEAAEASTLPPGGASLSALIAFAYQTGQAAQFGLPTTPDELAERLRAGVGVGAP